MYLYICVYIHNGDSIYWSIGAYICMYIYTYQLKGYKNHQTLTIMILLLLVALKLIGKLSNNYEKLIVLGGFSITACNPFLSQFLDTFTLHL